MKKFILTALLMLLVGCTSSFTPITKIDRGVAVHAGSQAAYEVVVTFVDTDPIRLKTASVTPIRCYTTKYTGNVVCELPYLAANDTWNIKNPWRNYKAYGSYKRANGTVVYFKL